MGLMGCRGGFVGSRKLKSLIAKDRFLWYVYKVEGFGVFGKVRVGVGVKSMILDLNMKVR